MSKNLGKGFKPLVLKYMSLFMALCYLANPLHQQIGTVLHEVSHLLEAPEAILSHHSHTSDHDIYEDHQHDLTTTDHQHTLLDFMDSLFDASDGQHPEDDTIPIPIKWDKHIGSYRYSLFKIFPIYNSPDSIAVEQKVSVGYFAVPDEPPQNFITSL